MNGSSESRTQGARPPNHLIDEKSPYLLQHAHNPVDWHPWGREAFAKAEREGKPIFLSIGYSTCHWCHVMERESFADPDVAQLLNDHFVSIKVDREERPDIDHVYMTVCQVMTGTGGWPLTIIMTPDKKPFFAATYIPKQTRPGHPGLVALLPQISTVWQEKRDDIRNTAQRVVQVLKASTLMTGTAQLDSTISEQAYQELVTTFDREHGGFGNAPKFPTPHTLCFLLRYWKNTGTGNALAMVEQTLERMRLGGICDHIGYGFHRYATDRQWRVPHFEKMLYDQALLTIAYTEAYQATKKEDFKNTARNIIRYVLRDMTAPEGGFYSAEDADSEGEEGRFYVWTPAEIEQVLGDEARFLTTIFNIKRAGNFRDEASRPRNADNILYLRSPVRELAAAMNVAAATVTERIENARAKLFAARDARIHPHKDDKILTGWNGLMIAALARAGRVFEKQEYLEAAAQAATFLLTHLRTADQRLLHRYRDGDAALPAHADDYAFLVWGLLELYEATFSIPYLEAARALNEQFITHYWDDEDGGFFFTAHDAEQVLIRQKQTFDGALPSANSVALGNLVRLARVTADVKLERMAEQLVRACAVRVRAAVTAHTHFLAAHDVMRMPGYDVVIVGDRLSDETRALIRPLKQEFIPNAVLLLKPVNEQTNQLLQIAPYLKAYEALDGRPTAYVCSNNSCQPPTTEPAQVLRLLGTRKKEE